MIFYAIEYLFRTIVFNGCEQSHSLGTPESIQPVPSSFSSACHEKPGCHECCLPILKASCPPTGTRPEKMQLLSQDTKGLPVLIWGKCSAHLPQHLCPSECCLSLMFSPLPDCEATAGGWRHLQNLSHCCREKVKRAIKTQTCTAGIQESKVELL